MLSSCHPQITKTTFYNSEFILTTTSDHVGRHSSNRVVPSPVHILGAKLAA